MYKITFFLALFFLCPLVIAKSKENNEKYFILYVEGQIMNLSQNKALKTGEFLYADDQLRFKDRSSKALVISGSKGRFMLQPEEDNTQKEGELISLVNKLLLPIKKNRDLSTRDIGISNLVMDLEGYLGMDKFYILGNSLSFRLNTETYHLNERDFLVLNYNYHGTSLTKKLPFEGNLVTIQKEAVFRSKTGEYIEPDSVDTVKLYQIYMPDSKNLLSEFKLCFMSEDQLKEVYQNLYHLEADSIPKETEAKYSYLVDFFVLSFGNTDEHILKTWLKQNNF